MRFFPVAPTSEAADSLFNTNGFESVTSVGLSFAGGDGAFYSEFMTDNLAIFMRMGYGRIGFGAFVQSEDVDEGSAPTDTTGTGEEPEGDVVAETAAERFLAAGGNATLYYALPVFAYDAKFNESDKETIGIQVFLLPRVGLDIPSLNAGTTDLNGNLNLSAMLNLRLLSHKGVFNMFGSIRGGYVPIASEEFYENLGREGAFGYATVEGGVILQDLIRIGVQGAIAGPSEFVERSPVLISVQLIPLRDDR
jgi:hypothetical protein